MFAITTNGTIITTQRGFFRIPRERMEEFNEHLILQQLSSNPLNLTYDGFVLVIYREVMVVTCSSFCEVFDIPIASQLQILEALRNHFEEGDL